MLLCLLFTWVWSWPTATWWSGPGTEARLPLCLKQGVTLVFVIYAISDLVLSIGLTLLRSIRDVLTHVVSRLFSDGKQRHLVYMKKASTFISPSTAAWPDPWLQPRRHIFLPMGDSLHGMELKAATFKPQRQTVRLSAGEELDRFRLSASVCPAQMSRSKGSGDNWKAFLSITIPNPISGKHYVAFIVWNGVKLWSKGVRLGTWPIQVTSQTIDSMSW